MDILAMIALATANSGCPNIEGVWLQGRGERVLVVEQNGCRFNGRVAEPEDQLLEVKGFWRGDGWEMAATRLGKCATTAWGRIKLSEGNLLITVLGTDGLCGPGGAPGSGPQAINATLTYRRAIPR